MKKLINHKYLGGDIIDRNPHKLPQRKPEKVMSGEELLNKAIHGTPKPLTEQEKRDRDLNKLLNKNI